MCYFHHIRFFHTSTGLLERYAQFSPTLSPPCFASSSCQLKGSLNVESGELPLVVSDFSVSPCEVYYFFPHTHSRANVFFFGVDVLHCEPSRLFQLLDLLLFLLFTKKIKKDQILLFDVGDDS